MATTSMAVLAMIVRREFSATLPMMPHLIALDTYVDELKTQDESMVGCYLNTVLVRMMMTWLGILINWEKSTMGPPGRKFTNVNNKGGRTRPPGERVAIGPTRERVLGLTRAPAHARGSSAGTVLTVLALRQHNTTSHAHACCVHASLTDRMPPPKC